MRCDLRPCIRNAGFQKTKLILIVLFAATILPLTSAAKRVTVAQLEQALNSASRGRKSDADIARMIGGFELTERLTDATLDQLRARISPGSLEGPALQLLADRSAFLEPPASELPAEAAPDNAAQNRMIEAARNYVSQTLPNLPNFLATRVIDLYDDSPQALKKGEWPTRSGLHMVGTSSGEISVRNERENQPATQGSAVWQAKLGLISGGEFGNTLGMILTDVSSGKMTWSHWEQSSVGRVAVFQYGVPPSASHYEVLSTLKREAIVEGVEGPSGSGGGGRIKGIEVRPNVSGSNFTVVRTKPGYHGAIWINPAGGTILRITLDADLARGAPFRRAAILVEYGPVNIAGSTFICPVRSIALSRALDDPETITGDAPSEWLNETHFTNYHRFGSTTRIVADSAGNSGPAKTDTPGQPVQTDATAVPLFAPAAEASQPEPQPRPSSPTAIAPPETPAVPTTSDAPSAAGAPPAAGVPPVAPVTQPIQPETLPAGQPANVPDSGVTLRIDVPELLVPVVVRDKQGRAVGNLGKDDFKLFDQGKERAITGFSIVKSATAIGGVQAAASVASAAESAPPVAAAPNRFIVFLFDDRHLTSSDLAITQKAATQMLDAPLAPTDHAAVLSLTGFNSGFTDDRAALQAAIMKLSVHQASQHSKEDCPDVDYYAADKIIHQHDAQEFQVAVLKAKDCINLMVYQTGPSNPASGIDNPTDPFQRTAMAAAYHALAVGEEDARQSLLSVEAVVRAMSKLQGQRILILVSPGFLSLSPDAMAFKSDLINLAASEDVIINTLDARGLYVGNADASMGPNAALSQVVGSTSTDHLRSVEANENALSELANGTGGTFFHNNNDLQGGLKSLAAAPEYLYLLEISLKDVKHNGTFHQLQVKVNQSGVDVESRRGYIAPRPAGKTK